MFYPSKTNVTILQIGLTRAKYYTGDIDGILNEQTQNSISALRDDNNITSDDFSEVLDILRPYLSGYTTHIVNPSDSFFSISKLYNTTPEAISYANPNISAQNLTIGSKLIVPLTKYATITDINYNSFICECIITGISVRYPFVKCEPIGKSVWGKMIYLLVIGAGEKQVFFNAEHHANEWITTPVLLKFIEDYAMSYASNSEMENINASVLYNSVTLFALCAVNPDGIDIVNDAIGGQKLDSVKSLAANYPDICFPNGWKANANGIDLNLQYPAGWENAKRIKFSLGYTLPGPRDFVGSYPICAPESRIVYDLTIKNNFILTVSYHTQGGVIYWKYLDYTPENSQKIALLLSESSGYILENTPYSSGFAGYKDWFIQTYNRPGYTVEAGLGENPLPISDFDNIYRDNYPLMAGALKAVTDLL